MYLANRLELKNLFEIIVKLIEFTPAVLEEKLIEMLN
jgi:hypothetical protein